MNENFISWSDDGVEEFNLKGGDASFLPVHHEVWVQSHLPLEVALCEEFRVNKFGHALNCTP